MKRKFSSCAFNRILYGFFLLSVFFLAWLYGGEFFYMTLYILLLLPVLSYALTFCMLWGLRVSQYISQTSLVKEEPGMYTVQIKNHTPFMFSPIECQFVESHFAVITDIKLENLYARPFKKESHEVPFHIKYRGEYRIGLRFIKVRDLTGLFTLKRKLREAITLTVLPRVTDLTYFPLAANLFSQSHSNFEIREEDYAIVSDIRPYLPSDSIKRVHWKLTAKRLEWLVKNFQSNALNQITLILDTAQLKLTPEINLAMEDNMVEFTLGLTQYCLLHAMPVAFVTGNHVKKEGRNQSDFDGMYHMAAGIPFDIPSGEQNALSLLNACILDSQNYINVVVITAQLSALLFERIVTANHEGHFISVVYAAPPEPDAEAEAIYQKLIESGVAQVRLHLCEEPI